MTFRRFIGLLAFAALTTSAAAQDGPMQDADGQAASRDIDRSGETQRSLSAWEPGAAQGIVPGVVWQPPESEPARARELAAIHGLGFNAVRIPTPLYDDLLVLADTLGVRVFVDLPLAYLPNTRLAEELLASDSLLTAISEASAVHPSLHAIGLAVAPDLGDDRVCRALMDISRSTALQTYLVAWPVSETECLDSVDLALRSRYDYALPNELAGIGGVASWGYALRRGAEGLLQEGSLERQAYGFEKDWGRMRAQNHLEVAFWYRWGAIDDLPSPFLNGFDLSTPDGSRSMTAHVIEQVLSETPPARNYPGGGPEPRSTPSARILGWALVLCLVVLLLFSTRFRLLAPRYFVSHVFYRQAVDEARDLVSVPTSILLGVFGLVSGLLAIHLVADFAHTPAAHVLYAWLGPGLRQLAEALQEAPSMALVLIGGTALLALLLWSSLWLPVARGRLRPLQTLTMSVWPRWSLLLLLVAVMVLSGESDPTRSAAAPVLAAAWLSSALWGSLRASIDLAHIARLPQAVAAAMWLVSPTWILIWGGLLVAWFRADHVAYLLHWISVGA